jgi:hypothetical protein
MTYRTGEDRFTAFDRAEAARTQQVEMVCSYDRRGSSLN